MDRSIRNSFEQSMVDSGYNIFESNINNSLRGFQKCISDDLGKKYYITIWHYNNSEQLGSDAVPKGDSYLADVQFRFESSTCNLEFWGETLPNKWNTPIINLGDFEDFFEKAWITLKPEYYEKL